MNLVKLMGFSFSESLIIRLCPEFELVVRNSRKYRLNDTRKSYLIDGYFFTCIDGINFNFIVYSKTGYSKLKK